MLRILLSCISSQSDDPRSPDQTLNQLPSTFATVAAKFRIDGKLIIRAVCPLCHANYDPVDGPTPYPSKCTNHRTPGSSCDAPLLDEIGRPIKTYAAHCFDDYLAGIFSDGALEDHILKSPQSILDPVPHALKSPHHGEFLRNLRGQDGNLFYCGPAGEARLTFALCIDFFATEGMNVRGPSTSLGIIALACLDLPVEIRYKPEYMYLVGIIPGPSEPSLTELNHYIEPLISAMMEAWHPGLHLTRTARKPEGRTVRCGIAIVVCDLPAARKTAQLAASTSKIFCSVCDCWDVRDADGKIIPNWRELRGRHDCEAWKARDVQAMRAAAEEWRDATSTAERTRIFEGHGVRWSALWRLPYWDPTQQLVVDSMHCLLEGLVKFHCLRALQIQESVVYSNPRHPPAFVWDFKLPITTSHEVNDREEVDEGAWSEKELKDLHKIHVALTAELCTEVGVPEPGVYTPTSLELYLARRLSRSLTYVQSDLGVTPSGSGSSSRVTKADISRSLVEWVKYSRNFIVLLLTLC